MQSLSLVGTKTELEAAFGKVRALSPSVTFFFAAPVLFSDDDFMRRLIEVSKDLCIIGCSTAGEIANKGVLEGGFSILSIAFAHTEVRVAHCPIPTMGDCLLSGEALADMLMGPKLKSVVVFAPGIDVNGSAIIEGLSNILGRHVLLVGGLASDEVSFKQTYTFLNGKVSTRDAVAVGLYGDHVIVSCGSEGGWRPFGPARRVTKADKNILYELDNKPALQLYKKYLGDKARNLPASGLSYPFAILREDRTTSGVIRSALNINHDEESIILAGNIEEGSQVCLMHADTGALTQGAAQAAAEALRTHAGPEEGGCALLVSFVGRKVVLGIDIDDEIEAVVDSLLPEIPVAGFYAYGEICSDVSTGQTELHNQTMTITYITESMGE
ncbi:MAG: FIST N-terminal domain-containing protein [Alphaproteobacteria bacterium]|nr:FIST N-terminal domain-containing protein [Alphaproteobacteria bacterium]